jgi:hypothetical protein
MTKIIDGGLGTKSS